MIRSALRIAATASLAATLLAATTAPGVRALGAVSVHVRLQPRVVQYRPVRISVSGISAAGVSVRLLDANDPAGLAYKWAPYPWRPLELVRGRWSGVLAAPPLLGIYQLQLRVRDRGVLQSPGWLLRVLPPRTLRRFAFATARAVLRHYVSALPGRQALVAVRPWPQAHFDHRDPRLHRIFAIAYAPRGDDRPGARLGLFITTVRNGYHGRWRLLEAATGPYD